MELYETATGAVSRADERAAVISEINAIWPTDPTH